MRFAPGSRVLRQEPEGRGPPLWPLTQYGRQVAGRGASSPSERRYRRQAEHKTPVRDAALPHIEKWLKENEWLSELPAKTVLDSASHVGRIAQAGYPGRRIHRAHVCPG